MRGTLFLGLKHFNELQLPCVSFLTWWEYLTREHDPGHEDAVGREMWGQLLKLCSQSRTLCFSYCTGENAPFRLLHVTSWLTVKFEVVVLDFSFFLSISCSDRGQILITTYFTFENSFQVFGAKKRTVVKIFRHVCF